MNLDSITEKLKAMFAYGERPRPYRDWFVVLVAGLTLFALSLLMNVWFFLRVASGESLGGTAPAVSAPTFNAAPLEAVDALFKNRADEAARYESQYPFVDPSR